MTPLEETLRELLRSGALGPFPDRRARLEALWTFGRRDLSLARLAEAHVDAVTILEEAGRGPVEGALYGVWASEGRGHTLTLEGGVLHGIKRFCSGASIVDRALVTAWVGDARSLVEVDVARVSPAPSDWVTPAFAETDTRAVRFVEVQIAPRALVGEANWYFERPGFWHGALGPAACWAGGTRRLADLLEALAPRDAHGRAHFAAVTAAAWGQRAALERACREADEAPTDAAAARRRARVVRHLVERAAVQALDRFGRAAGPAPIAFDAVASRHLAELALYVRQEHGERDLEALADDLAS